MFGLWGKKKAKTDNEKVKEMLGKVSIKTALEEYKRGEISRNELKQVVGVNDDKELYYLLQSCGFLQSKGQSETSKVERIVSAERRNAANSRAEELKAKKAAKADLTMTDEQAAKLAKAISLMLAKDEKK